MTSETVQDVIAVVFSVIILGFVLVFFVMWTPTALQDTRGGVAGLTAAELKTTHPNWTENDCVLIAAGKIVLGMTQTMVQASWGPPSDINRSVGPWGVHEQWVYGDFPYSQYLYFENGVLSSWQE